MTENTHTATVVASPVNRPEDAIRMLRCLPSAAHAALALRPPGVPDESLLLASAHVLRDIRDKLASVVGRANRAAIAATNAATIPPCASQTACMPVKP